MTCRMHYLTNSSNNSFSRVSTLVPDFALTSKYGTSNLSAFCYNLWTLIYN